MNQPSILSFTAPPAMPPLPSARARRMGSCVLAGIALAWGILGWAPPARAQFAITEFMAANNLTLNDEDGNNSDWIEIQNQSATGANLAGWFLTDDTNNLAKWSFPSTNLPPGGYLVVFASQKDRRTPGLPLHTNFKLSAGGEYLALVAPDGTNVVTQFAPAFPPQITDVSYGLVRDASTITLLGPGAPVRAFVPPNDNLGLSWTQVEFNDSSWTNGTTGVGYDRQPIGVNFLPLIGLNVESMMYPNNPTLYVRVPFTVANPGDLSGLTLRLKFEDGVIAYLNGQEIARSNAPANATFNSVALAPRTDPSATNFLDFDISQFRGFLVAGTNVLAFHSLNVPTNSPDLLLLPQLDGVTPNGPALARYFTVPTPGQANNAGVVAVGPVISDPLHTPAEPDDGENLIVTARLRSAFAPIASATLHYRVMFGSEVSIPFLDDGAHEDGAAGDGIYGATIPASASTPGQMVRWFITATDTTGTNVSRFPAYTATNDSPGYLGTVVRNPALTNALPVFHWFVQNVPATDTTTGTRASVFYHGEFYDNVFCRVRGATAPQFAKKPYKFDFNPGEHFRFQPGQPRASELNLNTTYQDKAYVRAPLALETCRVAGSPAGEAFNVRVQQNGSFYSVAVFVEQVDETYLARRGLDPNGALYKMFNVLDSSTTGVEKKTRRTEGNSDLQDLVTGLNVGNPNRAAFVYDHFEMPALINYLAAGVLFQDLDRVAKNFFLYRDTEGTGLWKVLPWDKDLTFGLFGLQSDCMSGSDDSLPYDGCHGGRISHPLFGSQGRSYVGGVNNLMDAVYGNPATREMFLRRLRTLMDQLLQPPGTPPAQRFYERRLDELSAELQADASIDFAKWRAGFGLQLDLSTAMGRLKVEYLDDRRKHLYQTHGIDNVGNYPDVAGIPHAQLGSPALVFGAIEFNPASGNQAQEYLELRNPNSVAVDVSGWSVGGGIDFTFQPGTVLPANGNLYLSPDIVAFRSRASGPRGGQGLFVVGNYRGQLSARGEPLQLSDARGVSVAATNYLGNPSAAQQFLRVTELMYHPSAFASSTNAEDFEFIELKNISPAVTLNLAGVRFIAGISFDFTGSSFPSLAPGGTVVVVKNASQFLNRYGGGRPIAGEYSGSLDNNGERLQLVDASGEEIHDFSYDPAWFPVTDGLGFSLVVIDALALPETWGASQSWRPSAELSGSPGQSNLPPPAIAPIRINEVLARTDTPPPTDSVELFNPTSGTVDVSGWFLTDDLKSPKKFRLPPGSLLPAGGFIVFNEEQFNFAGAGFAFSSLGDEAWLFSGDAQTNLTGYLHGFHFGASENGVPFTRYVNSQGQEDLVPEESLTLGAANSPPRVGPIVVSEIMYHPPGVGTNNNPQGQYIELQNITAGPVALYDPGHSTNSWRLRGQVDFDFPAGSSLAASGLLLVVSFDPVNDAAALQAFRAAYNLDETIPIFGPWQGILDNNPGTVRLERPDAPVLATVPYLLIERIQYQDGAPWPASDQGAGSSLQRLLPASYGNDPTNWFVAGRSPGTVNVPNLGPVVVITQPAAASVFGQAAPVTIVAAASDSDGTVAKVEFFVDGESIGIDSAPPFSLVWSNLIAGTHLLTARATDNRFASAVSGAITVRVQARPPTVALVSPTNGSLLLAGAPIGLAAAALAPDGFIAKVEFYSGPTKLGEMLSSPYLFSWTNAAPGTYTLSAVATDNNGLTALSSSVSVNVLTGYRTNRSLVATGSVWKYFDQGLDLGSSWRTAAFNDAAWASGPAQLGYGDGDEKTVVGSGPDGNHYTTTYFRRAFNVTGAAAFNALTLRVLRDDGAVVYLNGQEAFRTGMPDGPVAFNTLANVTATGGDETTNFYTGVVSPGLLQEGANLLAVEIHQVLPSSSDISFDLELGGLQMFFAPLITEQPATRSAPIGSTTAFTVSALGSAPLTYQWRLNGTNLPGANSGTLTLTNIGLAQGGSYSVVVANASGSATSQTALLGVTVPGGYAPTVLVDAPIHYYRFEESSASQNAADLGTPGGRNGIYTGGITLGQSTAPFRLGKAARFDGASGTLVDLGLFHPGNSVTVEAWANLDASANNNPAYNAIVARWDGSYELNLAPGDFANWNLYRDGNVFGQAAADTSSARAQWHHFVGVFSGGTAAIYVDGIKRGEQTIGGVLQNAGPSPDHVLIGATRDGSAGSFNWKGMIDEVAVYNQALPPDRILAHYQAGLPVATLTINAAGQIAWPSMPPGTILQVSGSLSGPAVWQTDN
ncbi:MAG: Spore coat protein CotH, partial [Verrucomicrobiales bacterium]|nr:Spore coat protein CotH [Verrucomicrobiales bacterium]